MLDTQLPRTRVSVAITRCKQHGHSVYCEAMKTCIILELSSTCKNQTCRKMEIVMFILWLCCCGRNGPRYIFYVEMGEPWSLFSLPATELQSFSP